jgi:hypothetical protein
MNAKNVTLGEFERRYGVNKGTVSKKARELGYETSEGLTPEAYEHLKVVLNVKETSHSEAIAPEVMPEDFIQSEKLSPVEERQIQLPNGFNPAVMVKFFDGVTGQATDTRSLVQIADLALNAVEGAMDEKLQAQRLQLGQSEKDAQQLAVKISEAKTRLQIKALESKLLAESQTKTTQSAEALFAELMAMGKPPAPHDGDND